MIDLVPMGNCGYDASALAVDGVGTLGFLALIATAAFVALQERQRARVLAATTRTVAPGPAVLTGVLERLGEASDDALWELRLDSGARVRLAPGAALGAFPAPGTRATLAGQLVPGAGASDGASGERQPAARDGGGYRAAPGEALVLAPAAGEPRIRVLPLDPVEAARARAAFHQRAGRYITWCAVALHLTLFAKYQALRFTGHVVQARVLERRPADLPPSRSSAAGMMRNYVRAAVPAHSGHEREVAAYVAVFDYDQERVPWLLSGVGNLDQIGTHPTVPWQAGLVSLLLLVITAVVYRAGARDLGRAPRPSGRGLQA